MVLKLLHKELGTAECFLEVGGACGELGDVANVTAFPEVAKSHLEEEEPMLSGVTQPPSSGGRDEPRTCCPEVLQAGKGYQGGWLCQKTKILLYTQGKKEEMSTKNNNKAL